MSKFFSMLGLTVWFFVGLYFGLSGLCKLKLEEEINTLEEKREQLQKIPMNRQIGDGPPLTNRFDYEYFMKVSKYEYFFPLVRTIPSFLGLILTAMCFSLLGSIVRVILRIVNSEDSGKIMYFSEPLLGFLTGLCVLGISYVLPTILVINADTIRPITLMFFSLFCGLYSKAFFEKLSEFFSKMFNKTV